MFCVSEITQLSDLGSRRPYLQKPEVGGFFFVPSYASENGRLELKTLSEADLRSFHANC